MKTGIASVWFVGLVITFLFVFSAYIIITVDYSKSFKLKNEVLNIIEKNKGMTLYVNGTNVDSTISGGTVVNKIGAIKTINAFLKASGYTAKGPCNVPARASAVYGVFALEFDNGKGWSNIGEQVTDKKKEYYYCLYYSVELFYKFEIPVLREFLPIRIDGVTDEVFLPDETHEPSVSCSNPHSKGICRNNHDYFVTVGG